MTLRLVLADDHVLVRRGLRLVLESEPDLVVVAEADDGAAAVTATRAHRPDVLLMDIQMPVLDGLAATRQILTDPKIATTRVMILTTFERDDYVFDALRLGASGFLLKTAPPEDLITAVRAAARGDALLSPSVTRRVVDEFSRLRHPAEPTPAYESLTAREREVLRHLATGRSNAEIGKALLLGEATVKTHVSGMLAKLGLRDRVQAVIYAYEHGLARPGTDCGSAVAEPGPREPVQQRGQERPPRTVNRY